MEGERRRDKIKKRETELGLPRFIVNSSEKPSRKRRGTSRN